MVLELAIGQAYFYSGTRCLADILMILRAMVYNHAPFPAENATNADLLTEVVYN